MASQKIGSNEYFKVLSNEFWAEYHDRACVMSHTHVHSVYELYFCPTPIAHRCVISGKDYTFAHPAVILVKPYTIHSMAAAGNWPKDQCWYVFSFGEDSAEKVGMERFLSEMFGDHMGLLFNLTPQQASYLEGILKYLFDPIYPLEEKESLSLFFFFLRRLHRLTENAQCTGAGTATGSVQQIMQYICENFPSPITTESVAAYFSVSRSKLDLDFKRAIGVTPKGFTELCRLHCAKKLLRTKKDMQIAQIAQMCGFPSENYFYRFFRQHTGMTPTQYKHTVTNDLHI